MESNNPPSAPPTADEHTDSAEARRTAIADLFQRIDEAGGFDFELDRDMRPAEDRNHLIGMTNEP